MRDESGFSYIELVIALALMSITAIALATALDFSRIALDQTAGFSQRTEGALARRDIRHWLQRFENAEGVQGTDTVFEFSHWPTVRPVNDAFLYKHTISVKGSDVGQQLVLETEGRSPKGDIVHFGSRVIVSGLSSAGIVYFGKPNPRVHAVWLDKWDYATGDLRLAKIEAIKLNGTPWPPLTIRVGVRPDRRIIDISEPIPNE